MLDRSNGYRALFNELDRLGCLWGPEGDRQIDRQYESYMLIIIPLIPFI
jgi:hypothetical protein